MKRFKIIAFFAALLLLIQAGMPMQVLAAGGKLFIASDVNGVNTTALNVGDTVTLTLTAKGSNNESVTASVKFTYDANVFSFVSCGAPGYAGGEGGEVRATGKTVTVKLKAVAPGDSGVKVTGESSGLDSMESAGVLLKVGAAGTAAAGSSDNSLSALSLSAGELSPAFASSVTSYTAQVPYGTTSVEVNATPAHEKARIEAITGSADLQVGENTINITVTAENGAKALYKVVVIRAAETAGEPGETTDPGADTTTNQQEEEYQYQISYWKEQYTKLDEKYKDEKSFSRKAMAVLAFVIIVLIIACINLLLFKRRAAGEPGEDIFPEEKKPRREKLENRHQSRKEDQFLDSDLEQAKEPDGKEMQSGEEEPVIKKEPDRKKAAPTVRNKDKDKKEEDSDLEFIDLDKL